MTVEIRPRAAFMPAIAVLALAVAACGAGTTSSGSGATATPTVTVQNIAYNPSSITVPAGTQVTITFTNKDSFTHSFTFDDNTKSVQAPGGQTETLVFTSPASGATIAFHCMFHSSMHGTITVGSGGGGAAPSSSGSSSSSGGGGYGGYGY